jgi:hypothetical protein
MNPKQSSRRKFIKSGAALAGLAAGALQPTSAQAPACEANPQKELKDLIAYGQRSRYVTSIRVPAAERPSRQTRSILCRPIAAPSFRTLIPRSIVF